MSIKICLWQRIKPYTLWSKVRWLINSTATLLIGGRVHFPGLSKSVQFKDQPLAYCSSEAIGKSTFFHLAKTRLLSGSSLYMKKKLFGLRLYPGFHKCRRLNSKACPSWLPHLHFTMPVSVKNGRNGRIIVIYSLYSSPVSKICNGALAFFASLLCHSFATHAMSDKTIGTNWQNDCFVQHDGFAKLLIYSLDWLPDNPFEASIN